MLALKKEMTPPLLAWYRAAARDLPWRKTHDPYPIWVSEIMLQQTRVAAVLGYYARFLSAFPRVEDLAAAPEGQLLKLWEGLGYYSRARNLKKAAGIVVSQGGFPETYRGLLALPGVGAYTAAAVASAAFGLPEAAVDGNVLRLAARLADCHEDVQAPGLRRQIRQAMQEVMPQAAADVRIFNQAAMELGATLCGPNAAPACDACPLGELCLGRRRGTAADLPVRRAKKPRRREEMTVFLLLRRGTAALRRRKERGLLAGLWEFPNVPGHLDEQAAAETVHTWGLMPVEWKERLTARHIFTHVEWHMTGYVLTVTGGGDPALNWADGAGLRGRAVPSAFGRYYQKALQELEGT